MDGAAVEGGDENLQLHPAARRDRDGPGQPGNRDLLVDREGSRLFAFPEVVDAEPEGGGQFERHRLLVGDPAVVVRGQLQDDGGVRRGVRRGIPRDGRSRDCRTESAHSGQIARKAFGRQPEFGPARQAGHGAHEIGLPQLFRLSGQSEREFGGRCGPVVRFELFDRILMPERMFVDRAGAQPVDDGLAARIVSVQVGGDFRRRFEPAEAAEISELCAQIRIGGELRGHPVIPGHHPPHLAVAAFVVGQQDEREVPGDSERLHDDRRLDREFREQPVLGE